MQKSFDGVAATTFLVFTVILGSIGFISLQGYSADARNSKRASDINTIQSAISTQLAQGQSILSFVTENNDNKIDSTSLSIGGKRNTSVSDYSAGQVNYMALPIKQEDFIDPIGASYVIGVSSRDNSIYELASSMEQGTGNKIAKVVGNYSPRDSKEVYCTSLSGSSNQLKLETKYVNMFTSGDKVTIKTDDGDIKTIIKAISIDGYVLNLRDSVKNPKMLKLSESESIGLIDQKDDDGKSGVNFVTDGGYNLPY